MADVATSSIDSVWDRNTAGGNTGSRLNEILDDQIESRAHVVAHVRSLRDIGVGLGGIAEHQDGGRQRNHGDSHSDNQFHERET